VRGVGGGHDRSALVKARQGMAAVDQDRNPTHQLYDGEEAKIRCSARAVGIRKLSLKIKLKGVPLIIQINDSRKIKQCGLKHIKT